MMKQLRFFSLLIAALLLCVPALAEQPTIQRQGIEMTGGSVFYPQLTGLEDETVQEEVNRRLLEAGRVEALLNRLPMLMQSPTKLMADYTAELRGNVLSCVMRADGPVETARATQSWATVNIDLLTGEDVTFAELFMDEEAARLAMEEYLEWEVSPELSAHLANHEVLPLPETFGISAAGLTLYYPPERLMTLGGRAGTVTILWSELRDHICLGEGSVLRRIGAEEMVTVGDASAAKIRQAVESGALPGIPATLGGSIADMVERYGLLVDPDLYEDGRMFQLEDGAFRQAYLLTDRLTEGVDNSVIQGVRADRAELYGLCTGVTQRQTWLDLLGEPDATVQLDDERAESYRMQPGSSDYYRFGAYQLRLHADESGVLASIFVTY